MYVVIQQSTLFNYLIPIAWATVSSTFAVLGMDYTL